MVTGILGRGVTQVIKDDKTAEEPCHWLSGQFWCCPSNSQWNVIRIFRLDVITWQGMLSHPIYLKDAEPPISATRTPRNLRVSRKTYEVRSLYHS